MIEKRKQKDPLPEEFASEDEAGAFWDRHDLTDYEDLMGPADVQFDLKRRHFEIEVDEESFHVLCQVASRQRRPVKQIASEILKEKLAG